MTTDPLAAIESLLRDHRLCERCDLIVQVETTRGHEPFDLRPVLRDYAAGVTLAPQPDTASRDVGPRDPESWKSGWNAAVKAYRDGEITLAPQPDTASRARDYDWYRREEDGALLYGVLMSKADLAALAPQPDTALLRGEPGDECMHGDGCDCLDVPQPDTDTVPTIDDAAGQAAAFANRVAAENTALREALENLARHHELERVHGNTHIHPDKCEFVMQADRALRAALAATEEADHG